MAAPVTTAELLGPVAPDWAEALRERVDLDALLDRLAAFLAAEQESGRGFQPAPERVLAAFARPLGQVRVLVVGQDPYPNPRYPIGLSFAVERSVRPLPGSLRNIHRELHDDLGVPTPTHGDLSRWTEAGVMLLNRVLTVTPGEANSHRGRGWEELTSAAVASLVARGGPLVAVLWGNQAAALAADLGEVPVVSSAHPSPLSARRGFFGSRPFSRVNDLLVAQGGDPVDWRLE